MHVFPQHSETEMSAVRVKTSFDGLNILTRFLMKVDIVVTGDWIPYAACPVCIGHILVWENVKKRPSLLNNDVIYVLLSKDMCHTISPSLYKEITIDTVCSFQKTSVDRKRNATCLKLQDSIYCPQNKQADGFSTTFTACILQSFL